MFRALLLLCAILLSYPAYCWNALGHRLIAQIAYDHLTQDAKRKYNRINHALDKIYGRQNLVNASVWLDVIHFKDNVNWYTAFHYVNLYFSTDGTPLPQAQNINALWAIENSIKSLHSVKTNIFDKAIALRVLIHVIGDIHQPLHGASKVSIHLPKGDMGGNIFPLGSNETADNLHWYWDQGGGYFRKHKRVNQTQLVKLARAIERQWPCDVSKADKIPTHWLNESHNLAVAIAYKIQPYDIPSKAYQNKARTISIQRVALAGCRLAGILNNLN